MKRSGRILSLLFGLVIINSCDFDSPNNEPNVQDKNILEEKVEINEGRDSYLPLVENSYYYFEGSIDDGRIFREKCTVKKFINNEEDTLYYFVDDRESINANIFGEGLYRHKNGNVMTSRSIEILENLDHLKMSSTAYENILVPAEPQEEQSYELRDNDWIKTATIISFEDVEVPAGKFEDCMRIKIKTVWQDDDKTTYEEHVWLKKRIGMIKWIRTTGRVDQLIKYNIPE